MSQINNSWTPHVLLDFLRSQHGGPRSQWRMPRCLDVSRSGHLRTSTTSYNWNYLFQSSLSSGQFDGASGISAKHLSFYVTTFPCRINFPLSQEVIGWMPYEYLRPRRLWWSLRILNALYGSHLVQTRRSSAYSRKGGLCGLPSSLAYLSICGSWCLWQSTKTHGEICPSAYALYDSIMSSSPAVRYVPLNSDSPAVFRGARASNYLTGEWCFKAVFWCLTCLVFSRQLPSL